MPFGSAATTKTLYAFFVAMGAAISVALGKEATLRQQLVVVLSAFGWGIALTPVFTQVVSNYLQQALGFTLTEDSLDSLQSTVALAVGLTGATITTTILTSSKLLIDKLLSQVSK